MRKRAISNWKKLKVLLIMLKLSGGKLESQQSIVIQQHKDNNEDEVGAATDANDEANQMQPHKTCKEKIAPYIIVPSNPYKLAWDSLVGLVYLMAYTTDPYVLAFHAVDPDYSKL